VTQHSLPPTDLHYEDAAALRPYLDMMGDDNPLHRDPAVAQAAGFDGLVVPGMMVMAQMIAALADWQGCAAIHDISAHFVQPVVTGTTLQVNGRVVALRTDGRAVMRLTAGKDRRPSVLGEAVITLARRSQADG